MGRPKGSKNKPKVEALSQMMADIANNVPAVEKVKKKGRPRIHPVITPEEKRNVSNYRKKEPYEVDKNWNGLMDIIKNHDYESQRYHLVATGLDANKTQLFDKITEWLLKKYHERI